MDDAKGEEEVQVEVEVEVVVVVKEPTTTNDPLFVDGDGGGYVVFDHSVCAFNTHLHHNPELLDVADSIEKGSRADTCKSLLLHTMTIMGGGDSYCCDSVDDDDEGCVDVDDILYDEEVKKKLQVLAAMVGIPHAASPEVVLAEVVTVLKELERDTTSGATEGNFY